LLLLCESVPPWPGDLEIICVMLAVDANEIGRVVGAANARPLRRCWIRTEGTGTHRSGSKVARSEDCVGRYAILYPVHHGVEETDRVGAGSASAPASRWGKPSARNCSRSVNAPASSRQPKFPVSKFVRIKSMTYTCARHASVRGGSRPCGSKPIRCRSVSRPLNPYRSCPA